MAEGRMLKKRISSSQKFAQLRNDKARLLYLILLPHVDSAGRYEADPFLIKAQVVPLLRFSHAQISQALIELAEAGLILLYRAEGKRCIEYARFRDFNKIRDSHEAESSLPSPDKADNGPPTEQLQPPARSTTAKLNRIELNRIEDNIKVIFEKWNSHKGKPAWKSHREITPDIKAAIRDRLKDQFTLSDLCIAIDNYATILTAKDYEWSYAWTLAQFLSRHRPDNRTEFQLCRFIPNNFAVTDFKLTAIGQNRQATRRQYTDKIMEASAEKVRQTYQDPNWQHLQFLIEELRSEVIQELKSEQ